MARRRTAAKHTQLLKLYRHLYEAMLVEQKGVCAICDRPPSEKRRLDLDHDHKALFIRGLLCVRCNRFLASWVTASWLRRAADYLDQGENTIVRHSRETAALLENS